MVASIFVSVAAYADPQLIPTLQSAMRQATHPERLVFGVLNQTESPLTDRARLQDFPVRLLQIPPEDSYGVSWARAVIQSLYDNETWYLQIDSHTHFAPGWDTHLEQSWQRLDHPQAIWSVYPYGYTREGDQVHYDCPVSSETTLVIRPLPDQTLRPGDYALRFHTRHLPERRPVRGCHLAGGFLFAPGAFVSEVPYDPQFYFHGEEQGLSLRAFTRGWDIFHPPEIPLYHWYKPYGVAHAGHHWNRRWQRPPELVAHLQERARARLQGLIEGRLSGVFGLGARRSLEDFAALSGIDYRGLRIDEPDNLRGRLL